MLYEIFDPKIWLPIIIVRTVVKLLLKVRLEVAVGYISFGIAVSFMNMLAMLVNSILYTFRQPRRASAGVDYPANPLHVNTTYQFSLSEVSLGQGDDKRPVRADLERAHTIIIGVTGSGKTIGLQSIMLQLFQRGSEFFDAYEVHIFDLKGDQDDNLWMWKPLVDGYYSITEGGMADAVERLEYLSDIAHRGRSKRLAVIIDEMAMFTQQSANRELRLRGTEAILRLSSQLRSSGFLLGATQRPHFESVPRNVSAQMERKVIFRVEDQRDAEGLGFRSRRKLEWDFSQFEAGEFVVKEPGRKRMYQHGVTTLVRSEHIEAVVVELTGELNNDVRVQVLKEAVTGVGVGKRIKGANRIVKSVDVTNNKISEFYRAFAELGIIKPKLDVNGAVSYYTLEMPVDGAILALENAIRAGIYPHGL